MVVIIVIVRSRPNAAADDAFPLVRQSFPLARNRLFFAFFDLHVEAAIKPFRSVRSRPQCLPALAEFGSRLLGAGFEFNIGLPVVLTPLVRYGRLVAALTRMAAGVSTANLTAKNLAIRG